MIVIIGIIYPLFITGFSHLVFPQKADGSMISNGQKIVGSQLIGQQFSKPEYFWGRPSAIQNNPMPSAGSNLNPIGDSLKVKVQSRIDAISKYQGNIKISEIPKDLLFASGSGVDPHISPEAVFFQFDRVVNYRHFTEVQKNILRKIINNSIESPDIYIFGEPRVNVLNLNLELDKIKN